MVTHCIVPATSLTVDVGPLFGVTNGGGGVPIISMNFPPAFAEALTEKLLKPYAKPEDFVVGMNPCGQAFEVSAFCALEQDALVYLPMPRPILGILPEGKQSLEGPYRYIIGTQADIGVKSIGKFLGRKAALGKYYVVCGHHVADDQPRTAIIRHWHVCLETIYGQEVYDLIKRLTTG